MFERFLEAVTDFDTRHGCGRGQGKRRRTQRRSFLDRLAHVYRFDSNPWTRVLDDSMPGTDYDPHADLRCALLPTGGTLFAYDVATNTMTHTHPA